MRSGPFRLVAIAVASILSAAGPAAAQRPDSLGSCPLQNSIGTSNNPEHTLAVGFHASPQVKACNEFLPKMMRQRNPMQVAYNFASVTPAHRQLAASYFDTCLTGDPAVYAPHLSPAETEAIKSRTMLLTTTTGRLLCHGFRLNGRVVTADHCLRDAKLGDEVKVRTLDSAQLLTAVVALRGGSNGQIRPERDYAVLRLQTPIAGDTTTDVDWLAAPAAGHRIFITQVNIYALIAREAELQGSFASVAVTLDNPTCRLGLSATGEYLLHPCPTEGGTSGAAYIQRSAEGGLLLVAVHGGETAGLSRRELRDCERALPNYGVTLPRDVIGQALR